MDFLFKSWASLGKTLLLAVLIYPLLIVVLRAGGKRTLSKMNAFDFIVAVAIGSLLASTILSTASLAEGVGAISALVAFQTLITWLSVRSDRFEALVKSQPTLVFHDGQYIERAMRSQRVTREEIRNAIRTSSSASVEDTAAVDLGVRRVVLGPRNRRGREGRGARGCRRGRRPLGHRGRSRGRSRTQEPGVG